MEVSSVARERDVSVTGIATFCWQGLGCLMLVSRL